VLGEFFRRTGLPPTMAGSPILKGSQIGKFQGRISVKLEMIFYLGKDPKAIVLQ
jgi:hypothetical protein